MSTALAQVAASGVDVALRVPLDGEFVVVAQTTTDADGRFRFSQLPLESPNLYLPGANLADIHFPGPRVTLDLDQPSASVTLVVFESTDDPSPLVVEDHKIVVQAESGVLRVRETMLIDNPSTTCFVGRPQHEGGGPVTLQLGIPADFERITFDQEGFGRQFQLINGKLVTGVPWPPGKRELGFSYVIANQQGTRVWQRRVDLPSSHVQITVHGSNPQHVACSLPAATDPMSGVIGFAAGDKPLGAGDVIQLELDRLPIPAMVSALDGFGAPATAHHGCWRDFISPSSCRTQHDTLL